MTQSMLQSDKTSFLPYQQQAPSQLPLLQMVQKSPQKLPVSHRSHASLGGYIHTNPNSDELGFDRFMDKQNHILNKVLGSGRGQERQDQMELYQQKMKMQQRIQELEKNKIQAELELVKFKSKQLEQELEQRNKNGLLDRSSLYDIKVRQPQRQGHVRHLSNGITQSQILNRSQMNILGHKEEENKQSKEEAVETEERLSNKAQIKIPMKSIRFRRNRSQEDIPNLDQELDLLSGSKTSNGHLVPSSHVSSIHHMSVPGSIVLDHPSKTSTMNTDNKIVITDSVLDNKSHDVVASHNEEEELIAQEKTEKKLGGKLKKSKRSKRKHEGEEKKVRFEDNPRKKAEGRVRGICWSLVLGRLLYNEVKNRVLEQRETFERNISGNIAQIYDLLKNFILQSAGKEILAMLTNKQCFGYAGLPSSQNKKSEKISKEFLDSFKTIFNKLIVETSNLSSVLVHIMRPLVKENSFLPYDYFSSFELNRLHFTNFGKTKDMNAQRGKLLLGGIIIIRALIYLIIMRPWDAFGQPKSKFKEEKLLNLGSIMYHTTINIFKGSLLVTPNNQSFLSVDLKVHPKKRPLQAMDGLKPENGFKADDPEKDGGIIEGFYPRNQLSSFFVDNKTTGAELKMLIEGWLNALYEKVHG